MIEQNCIHIFQFNFPKTDITPAHIQMLNKYMTGVHVLQIEEIDKNSCQIYVSVRNSMNDTFLGLCSDFLNYALVGLKFSEPQLIYESTL